MRSSKNSNQEKPMSDQLPAVLVLAPLFGALLVTLARSEERRVGKECVSTCRSRWTPDHLIKNHRHMFVSSRVIDAINGEYLKHFLDSESVLHGAEQRYKLTLDFFFFFQAEDGIRGSPE